MKALILNLYCQTSQPHEPVGTFFDSKRGILRSFPGGGVPVLVDHVGVQKIISTNTIICICQYVFNIFTSFLQQHKRCSSNFIGIKPHPNQRQYYYVCKPDCVIFGKCQSLQVKGEILK